MCYSKVEHKIFHLRVKKKAGHQRASSPHHKNVMFCGRVPLPVRAGRQRKKNRKNKQIQIILILLLLFFFNVDELG